MSSLVCMDQAKDFVSLKNCYDILEVLLAVTLTYFVIYFLFYYYILLISVSLISSQNFKKGLFV